MPSMADTCHFDPLGDLRPLPLRHDPAVARVVQDIVSTHPPVVAEVATRTGHLRIGLSTDSAHLRRFFTLQWPRPPAGAADDALIVAMRRPAAAYGLDGSLDGVRTVDTERSTIVSFGTEYYGNVKVSTRGLCSAAFASERKELFVHGAAIAIAGGGVVLSGASGAGKTTCVAALRNRLGAGIRIVNDDWGPASVTSRQLTYTGEDRLHMKYPSVRALNPGLSPNPGSHPSENFRGDPLDPHARLLITPAEVFGAACLPTAEWRLYVALFRDESMPFTVRPLTGDDVGVLEESHFAAFYNRSERFLDGSLLHLTDEHVAETRGQYQTILETIPALFVNNTGLPEQAADAILEAMDHA